jgi:hypothetical protein
MRGQMAIKAKSAPCASPTPRNTKRNSASARL